MWCVGAAKEKILGDTVVLEITKPEMSRPFWVAFCLAYAIGFLAIYSMFNMPERFLDTQSSLGNIAAFKITTIRVFVISFAMACYPVLLVKSLRLSKYFIISITAWTLAMYIDDHLVLYKVIAYPEKISVAFLLAIRPLGILALLWMSIEIYVKLAVKE